MKFLRIGLLVLLTAACAPEPEDHEHLEGPIDGLTNEQVHTFALGDETFERFFTPDEGLGPRFNQASCESCHPADGAGDPNTMFFRFGRLVGDTFDPLLEYGGPQLQDRAILGFEPETLPEQANAVTGFMGLPVTGLGYLEAVEESTLWAMEDAAKENKDGVRGRVQLVPATDDIRRMVARENATRPADNRIQEYDGHYIGRFGRKSVTTSLLHQTVNALSEDMGLTSTYAPYNLLSPNDAGYPGAGALSENSGTGPEISDPILNALVFYMKTLRAPDRRNADDPSVRAGEDVFESIGCTSCHTPTLTTGPSTIEALDRVTFHPYTDLLLHDMGDELNDGYTEGHAAPSEWRTTPLWGLGLRRDAQGGKLFLLHDGRAHSFDEAIEYHGGEASAARAAYQALPSADKAHLRAFLESL